MATIEHFVEQWAQEKRKILSMTDQESVRIWNVIQSKLEIPVISDQKSVIKEHRWSFGLNHVMLRWSIIPVAAMALLIITTTVEKSSDIPTIPQTLPVVLNDKKIDIEPLNVVEVQNGDTGFKKVRTVALKRQTVEKRELYASRGQSVFVTWGTSVFSPEQASTRSGEVLGTSVFSEL